jgi:hypothetical protein
MHHWIYTRGGPTANYPKPSPRFLMGNHRHVCYYQDDDGDDYGESDGQTSKTAPARAPLSMFSTIILIGYVVGSLRGTLSSDVIRIKQISRLKGGFLGLNFGRCESMNESIVLGT